MEAHALAIETVEAITRATRAILNRVRTEQHVPFLRVQRHPNGLFLIVIDTDVVGLEDREVEDGSAAARGVVVLREEDRRRLPRGRAPRPRFPVERPRFRRALAFLAQRTAKRVQPGAVGREIDTLLRVGVVVDFKHPGNFPDAIAKRRKEDGGSRSTGARRRAVIMVHP